MDVVVATAALVFVLPLMTIVAVLLYAFDPGPIWFVQTRIGRGGRPFYCIKFRTMAVDAEARLERLLAADPEAAREWRLNHKLAYDPRITSLGAFLRSSSLDELPQLINVIRGEMSLVGPRPIVPAETKRYGRYFAYYCDVRPGLTGMWQVLGRGRVSYRRRVAMDVLYVRKRTIWMNIWLIIATIPAVLLRKGAA
jgi:lipopolysaccharide/colanic/teichoic acid biosynthesis glycosyltransferase